MSSSNVGRTLKTADAVLHVLRFMAASEDGLTTEDVAELTDKSPATATYLLNSLVAEGFARRASDHRYCLDDPMADSAAGTIAGTIEDLSSAAEELFGRTGERSYIGLPTDYSLEIHDTWGRRSQQLVPGLSPQVEGTAHALAIGKAVLAHLRPEVLDGYIDHYGLTKYTPATITDRDRLSAELEAVRTIGVAVDDEEFTEGCSCLSAPIFDGEGQLRGAVAISISHAKFTSHKDRLIPTLRHIAQQSSGSAPDGTNPKGQQQANHRIRRRIGHLRAAV